MTCWAGLLQLQVSWAWFQVDPAGHWAFGTQLFPCFVKPALQLQSVLWGLGDEFAGQFAHWRVSGLKSCWLLLQMQVCWLLSGAELLGHWRQTDWILAVPATHAHAPFLHS